MGTVDPSENQDSALNPYIRKRGDKYVIVQKRTGEVLSEHDTKEKAEESFAAMEANKHGGESQ